MLRTVLGSLCKPSRTIVPLPGSRPRLQLLQWKSNSASTFSSPRHKCWLCQCQCQTQNGQGPGVINRRTFSSKDNNSLSHEELTEEEERVLAELEREEALYRQKEEGDGNLKDSVSQVYVPFQDQQRIIQDVIEEIWNPLPQEEEQVYKPPPEFLLRGKSGVFDLAELVDLLRKENCHELVVIGIPKEMDYADHMVIVTCRSPRHLLATATYVRKRFKMKELKRSDVMPNIISKNGQQGWIALDLGNIILNLFLQRQRDHFDLELLWTVGPMFDDLCNMEDSEIIKLLNSFK